MGERGPAPKDPTKRMRRNEPKQRRRNLTPVYPDPPELPEGLSGETITWWEGWLEQPQSTHFTATDWNSLLRCARLVEMFNSQPTAQLAAEIGRIEAKLGATIADRDRLGMKFEEPSALPLEPINPTPSRQSVDPRLAAK